MKFSLPKNIHYIISEINKNGYSAHLVGGCVRDMFIGKEASDWDITTNASPSAVKAMFQKTYETGIKHGTITVFYKETSAEVTTWRTESKYSDHRRPDHIAVASSLHEDLSRRDFSINAIAYHPDEGLIDPFKGIDDINNQIIRCVGDPFIRFSEDALRMLRAVRFSASLYFQIEEKTLSAIKKLRQDLAFVSMERIHAEVNKILESTFPERIILLWKAGLSNIIFPEIETLPSCWTRMVSKYKHLFSGRAILLSLLFYFVFGDKAIQASNKLLTRLRYDNTTIREVIQQIQSVQELGNPSDRNIRKMVSLYGEIISRNSLIVAYELSGFKISSSDLNLGAILAPQQMSLSGNDLINSGFCTGKAIGEMLSLLSLCVYEKPGINDKNTLMNLAIEISCHPLWKKTFS